MYKQTQTTCKRKELEEKWEKDWKKKKQRNKNISSEQANLTK